MASLFDAPPSGDPSAVNALPIGIIWAPNEISELRLVRVALDLGADKVFGDLSAAELRLADQARATEAPPVGVVDRFRSAILAGEDPLGDLLCRIWPGASRRALGAFYTPKALIDPMVDWALSKNPSRLVDPGCGSGRFVAAAVRRCGSVPVIAIDVDPIATLITRGVLAALDARNAAVLQTDYLTLDLRPEPGVTAYVGNPPYVRHHDLSVAAKRWALNAARSIGRTASALAGLHAYFFLATALHARAGDIGCFLTSAEWLDVNYGSIIRELLLYHLGANSLHLIDPRAVSFDDAMSTAVITCFQVGSTAPTVKVRLVESPDSLIRLAGGREVPRDALVAQQRWTSLARIQCGTGDHHIGVPLKTIARVHRGLVTGANDFFVLAREQARAMGIERWCRPAITSAKEILESDGVVRNTATRRVLLDIPKDIDRGGHPSLDRYLRAGETARPGHAPVSERYIARHRRPWWYLGPAVAPPIVATYMARQAPMFALNPDGLALINIAHGIYPKSDLNAAELAALVSALNGARQSYRGAGRTYQGGLEKFEPAEMESLLVPEIVG